MMVGSCRAWRRGGMMQQLPLRICDVRRRKGYPSLIRGAGTTVDSARCRALRSRTGRLGVRICTRSSKTTNYAVSAGSSWSAMCRAQRTASSSGGPDLEPQRPMTSARWYGLRTFFVLAGASTVWTRIRTRSLWATPARRATLSDGMRCRGCSAVTEPPVLPAPLPADADRPTTARPAR